MLSLASLFVVLGFLVLIGLLANVGMTTARKLETQNAADAAAYSASVEMARGMNAVTAANHLMGELTALVVLIHTLAGDTLDGGDAPSTPKLLKTGLDIAYDVANPLSQDTDIKVLSEAYDNIKKDSKVDGAIYDARMRLKQILIWALEVHGVGALISKGKYVPIIGPIFEGLGDFFEGCAVAFEAKALQEWVTLDGLEYLARGLHYAKVAMRDALIPALSAYSVSVFWLTPKYVRDAASAVGGPNAATCAIYPMIPMLPLEPEPTKLNDPKKSQLVRASTPWIQWWRQPWIDWGKKAILLSRFAYYYEKRSTDYTLPIIKGLKEKSGFKMYVLKGTDLNGKGKTFESWTYGSRAASDEADQKFTVVGFAHRDRPPLLRGGGIFRQENPKGMVCYAQAMIYNANAQKRGSGNADWQATVGWDTLNWAGPAPEFPGPLPPGDNVPTPTTPQPLTRLNWQAKLVPTTRLDEAIQWSKFNPVIDGRIRDALPLPYTTKSLSRTH
jgi:hypothetical protein